MCSFAQQSVSWGPEIPVADGTTYGNVRPRIALTNGNVPVVVFGKSGNGDLHVARWNGAAFGTPVNILPAGTGTYIANWTGPDIAAHGDTVIAVFKALPFDSGKAYAVRSVDGGLTFSDTLRIDDHTTGRVFMPALEMDADGNPSVNYMVFDGNSGDPRWAVSKSSDAGVTYGAGQEVSTVLFGEACDCCPAEIAIDGDRQVLLFRNNMSNVRDVHGVLSEDGGTTFNVGGNLEYLGWSVNTCPSTGPHGFITGDSLFTVSASKASGSYRIYIGSAGIDGGVTANQQFSPVPPANVNGAQNFPRVSAQNDTIVLVWEEKETSNPDVFCAVVTDGMISGLSAYKSRINESTGSVQTNPDVVYRDGFVHVVYQDAASGDVIYRKGTIVDVAGTEEQAVLQANIFPNPSADGVFTITGIPAANWEATVTDLSGKRVNAALRATAQGWEITVDAAAGTYTLVLENGSGTIAQSQLIIRK